MARAKIRQTYEGRISEQYLLAQVNYHYDSDSFRDHKERMANGDSLYRGDLAGLFPSESALPPVSLVENKFKNALHDISRLASEGRGMVKFPPRGDSTRDLKQARVRSAINTSYWAVNDMQTRERKLYLDLAGTGMMGTALYFNDRSPYPQSNLLNPRFSYPDVRDGKLQSLLHVEMVKERVLAHQFPHLGLNADPGNQIEGLFVVLYETDEVAEAVLMPGASGGWNEPWVTKRWQHNLECVPVAYEQLDTYDGAFHGLFEQLAGPLMVRNKTVRFMVDYLEQMAHSPLFAMNILNADDEPGPTTVYQGDPTADNVRLERIGPGAPSSAVFGLLNYMADQEEKESLQPPSRSGNVSQSIASGTFVDRTQGQLTSVVKEMQDKMASLRKQFNYIAMKIDEAELDFEKPLLRPVSGKATYLPSKDIDKWYIHEVKFGAGAGLDRLSADTRVQNHFAVGLISAETARGEIDYLDDDTDEQDKIDKADFARAIKQRFLTDPSSSISALVNAFLAMEDEGVGMVDALKKVAPEIAAKEQAMGQQGQPGAMPAGMPGSQPEGAPAEQGTEQLDINAPMPPIAQLFPGRNY